MRQRQSGHCAWRPRGLMAVTNPGFIHIALWIQIQGAMSGGRRSFTEINRLGLALGHIMGQQKAAAAEIAGLRQGHRQREADRDRRIHCVAALFQHHPIQLH